ncbi:hypothetical protein BDK92_6397 [Micromonospora pisi]|uniref:Uncharacterized protein n=1 Tax=Micromonospora pisi TaxID=589240 RepID=A0A495JSK4_9ACTN|nr:RICIN domain-containing protein [Micromonospora pisi]RKR91966.1 hypothetical protein BDK92_6397 [Micromonospora pisi]
MRVIRRLLATTAAVLTALVVTLVIPVGAASAAPPIDPAFPGSWAKWTFHAGGDYNQVLEIGGAGGAGTAAQLYGDNSGSNQVWFQEAAAEGGQFLHPGYNRWLCLGRSGNEWGARVEVQNCDGSSNQRWGIPRYAQQWFLIKPWNDTSVCIDVPGSNFSQGVDLNLWGCNQSSAQYWQTGRCYASGCDDQWPDVTDCDTAGADEVRDVSQDGDRVVLVYSAGCHAYFARLSHSSGSWSSVDLVFYRSHPRAGLTTRKFVVNGGEMRWSSLLGADSEGSWFEACYESPLNPADGRFCSGGATSN